MNELIWVGNTLLPRGFVFAVIGAVALVIVGTFVYFTR
jgi:hypothetical protein